MSKLLSCVVLACLLAFPAGALAHRVNIFAYVDGDSIVADCFYSKSNKVNNGALSVRNAATGEEYLKVTTDAQGAVKFPVPAKAVAERADIRLVLVAGEGHQSDEVIPAADFAALSAKSAAKTAAKPVAQTAKSKPAAAAPGTTGATGAKETASAKGTLGATAQAAPAALDEAALGRIVEEAVDRSLEAKLAPVRRLLAENVKQGPGPTEIVGGIGYIVGLCGVAAFVAARRKRGSGE